MKKRLTLFVCALIVLTLGGCNTFAGLGKDLHDSAQWLDYKLTNGSNSPNP